MHFESSNRVGVGPFWGELSGGRLTLGRRALGWFLGRGPRFARVALRWSQSSAASLTGEREGPTAVEDSASELLYAYNRRARLGLAPARRLAWLAVIFGASSWVLVHGPRDLRDRVAGEAPDGQHVVVQEGDSLGRISATWNVPLDELRRANPALVGDVIYVGQEIALPLGDVRVAPWRVKAAEVVDEAVPAERQAQLDQVSAGIGLLGLLFVGLVPLSLIRRRYERQTVWVYDLGPVTMARMAAVYVALSEAVASGLATHGGKAVTFEEASVPALTCNVTVGILTVGPRRLALLPDRVLFLEGGVAKAINWDDFVLRFPPPDVVTGVGLGLAPDVLPLVTPQFEALLKHPDTQQLERLEAVFAAILD